MKTEDMTFGVFVTSNASMTHILFGESLVTPCGLNNEPFETKGPRYPCSEVRAEMPAKEFKNWIELNRHVYSHMRLCKRCLKAFDKWCSQQK